MNANTHCAECGAQFPVHPASYSGASGYAVRKDGARVCYTCSDKREVESLKDRSRSFCAYVSSDGTKITSWPGGVLMTVIASRPCQLTRQSFTHDRNSYRSIRARDVHGRDWAGRGSAGICIRLRPVG